MKTPVLREEMPAIMERWQSPAYCTSPENLRSSEMAIRGFKSHPLRSYVTHYPNGRDADCNSVCDRSIRSCVFTI